MVSCYAHVFVRLSVVIVMDRHLCALLGSEAAFSSS